MTEQIPPQWEKFERDGLSEVRRKLAAGLYRPERAQWARHWLAFRAKQPKQGVWSQDRQEQLQRSRRSRKAALAGLNIFLSYHHGDKQLAGKIKSELKAFGFSVFVAHDDIDPSHEWQEEILRQLKVCQAFLLILTRGFHRSRWTDQETGIAIARNKVVMPLRVDTNPYGFAGRFQALPFQRRQPKRSCLNLLRALQRHRRLKSRTVNSLINTFGESSSFDESRDKFALLLECGRMTKTQTNQVARVSGRNPQIYLSYPTAQKLERFLRKNRRLIEPRVLKEYRAAWSRARFGKAP